MYSRSLETSIAQYHKKSIEEEVPLRRRYPGGWWSRKKDRSARIAGAVAVAAAAVAESNTAVCATTPHRFLEAGRLHHQEPRQTGSSIFLLAVLRVSRSSQSRWSPIVMPDG